MRRQRRARRAAHERAPLSDGGLDVRTAEFVRAKITELAEQGAAALLISTEIDELIALCDRIAVMSRGVITGVVENEAGAEERVGELMVSR